MVAAFEINCNKILEHPLLGEVPEGRDGYTCRRNLNRSVID